MLNPQDTGVSCTCCMTTPRGCGCRLGFAGSLRWPFCRATDVMSRTTASQRTCRCCRWAAWPQLLRRGLSEPVGVDNGPPVVGSLQVQHICASARPGHLKPGKCHAACAVGAAPVTTAHARRCWRIGLPSCAPPWHTAHSTAAPLCSWRAAEGSSDHGAAVCCCCLGTSS
jgi:hypothetical protein